MDGQTFLDDLRGEHETELSRLGSSKGVYAFTGGEMEGAAVRTGTARELNAVAPVLETWADAADGDVATLYADVASFLADTATALDGEAAPSEGAEEVHVTAEALSALDDELARVAGVAAALLVLGKLSEQLVGFFVGDADRAGAREFRELRDTLQAYRDEAAAQLETSCTDDADWAAAQDAAAGVVEGAYDWYVETLEAMGVEPKNVC
jgi:hypothetical protein